MPPFSPCRILRAASQEHPNLPDRIRSLAETTSNWTSTLVLPKSQFPARPSPEQIDTYRRRCSDDLYAWQRASRSGTKQHGETKIDNDFILHDGPPYANGAVHVGHALNKVLKDLMVRWELSRGKRVRYVPGWDCHGLPIELKALQQPNAPGKQAKALNDAPGQEAKAAITAGTRMTALEIRTAARKLASETIDIQRKSFREWGIMGEWDKPYKTMNKDFEIRQLGVFREMVRKGLISRHHRPVYWSPSSRTALAEAELEYDDNHKCTAAFVKMPLVRLPQALRSHPAIRAGSISALIWTTTPWTLPANRAIAVRSDIEYSVVEIMDTSKKTSEQDQLLIGKERIEHVLSHLPDEFAATVVVESVRGSDLVDGNAACYNIFSAAESQIIQADFVTATSGTGLVHMAPGHGMEDYQVCQSHDIGPAFAPVDDEGRYTAEAFPIGSQDIQFQGLEVQTQGVKSVLDVLMKPMKYLPENLKIGESLLLATHNFVHKNPIDWRTKQPVIVRATAQWFADVSAIKDRALEALDDVRFIPESGKSRLRSFVEGRSQWCISRQRTWGVPIPALYHVDTGEVCITDKSIEHIISTIEQRGVDAWFSDAADEGSWLHSSLEPGKWIRGRDTMDVWFDSGTTWTSLETRSTFSQLSDVYVEGTDQHRGWFQSSLLTAIATQDSNSKPLAPFKVLATHGFTLDGDGRKMSKSLGNVISPEEILMGSLLPAAKSKNKKKGSQSPQPPTGKKAQQNMMGPDLLRLLVASSDYTRDVSISQPVLQNTQQFLQKCRVTFKFLLGVLHDYPAPTAQQQLLVEHGFADRAVLWQLAKCSQHVYGAYSEYRFYAGVSDINKFIMNDLSAFYFEVIKDTLYTGNTTSRRHIQTILMSVLHELLRMLGPVTPHLVEEVWEWMPPEMKPSMDMHPLRQVWHHPLDFPDFTSDLQESLEVFRRVSSAVKIAQEEARDAKHLRSGLACRVVVRLPNELEEHVRDISWLHNEELPGLLVVSQAEVRYAFDESKDSDWRYEQPIEFEWSGRTVKGIVVVLPPSGEKCVRCWKYTADEQNLPCSQCCEVLAETML